MFRLLKIVPKIIKINKKNTVNRHTAKFLKYVYGQIFQLILSARLKFVCHIQTDFMQIQNQRLMLKSIIKRI